MDSIKTYYFNGFQNAGDLLTVLLVKELFNKEVIHQSISTCSLIGIGSILDLISINTRDTEQLKNKSYEDARIVFQSTYNTHVWSSGFMCMQGRIPQVFWHKKLVFNALRGELTKKFVEEVTGNNLSDIAMGDGGLLSSLLVKKVEKKYHVGFVPHYFDIENKSFLKLMNNYKNSRFIDIRNNPLNVIQEIASCEIILSSSLHGLIIADSFGIPNKRFVVSDYLRADTEFKYRDYYSAFNLKCKTFDCENKTIFPSINQITDEYKVKYKDVLEKQEKLIKAFPFK